MSITLGVVSVKGGVGKTTVAASLAADLANQYGKKVLLVDANFSAPNLGLHMDITSPEKTVHEVLAGQARIESAVHNVYGVDVLPGHYNYSKEYSPLKLKDRIAKIKDKYDFVILDSSPSPGDEMLSTVTASDALFLISTPDLPTLTGTLHAARIAKQRGTHIAGIILNKMRDKQYDLTIEQIEETTGVPVVAALPDDKNLVRALAGRIPMNLYSPRSKFSQELHSLNDALIGIKQEPKWYQKIFFMNMSRPEVNREILQHDFYKSVFNPHG